MAFLGKTMVAAIAIGCVAALAISIFPGWLNDLLLLAVLIGVLASPVIFMVLGVIAFVQYRRGNLHLGRIPWKHAAISLAILVITFTALRFYIPRRIVFSSYQSSFKKLVDDGVADDREFDQRIGPFHIDECLTDSRGGIYFRVYSSANGIGPDVMSYGFCYKPNRDGSPFGADHYRTFRMGNDWYWFRASDDWF